MSDVLKKYVEEILRESGAKGKERADLADELYDHLLCIRSEYIEKGIPELEADKLAMQEFGDSRKVGKAMNPHRIMERLARILAVFHILLIQYYIFAVSEFFLPFMNRVNEILYAPLGHMESYWGPIAILFQYLPVGLLAPIAWRAFRRWDRATLLASGLFAVHQGLQFLVILLFFEPGPMGITVLIRMFDWTGMMMATTGGLTGYLLLKGILQIKPLASRLPHLK
jgi:hypothetical protein